MKVEITSRKGVRPSSAASSHPSEFKLSLLGQLCPSFYGLIIFFYEANIQHQADISSQISERSLLLQNSLSQVLTRFYPLAGRLSGDACIDCNDKGAYFIEAQVDSNLSDFLKEPNINELNQFLPLSDPKLVEFASNCLFLVQFTAFCCGGTAISVCGNHKICDAASLLTILQSWTSTARESSNEPVVPQFIGASLIPPNDRLPHIMPPTDVISEKLITKRFVFQGSAITSLRDKIIGAMQHYPSRVETVLSLIWKCASSASKTKAETSSSTDNANKPLSVLLQTVNLRTRIVPPLPQSSIGNLIQPVPVILEQNETELHDMVHKMRKAITHFSNEKADRFKGEEAFSVITELLGERRHKLKDVESFRSTSWCKFLLYETNFGWGKPAWVSSAALAHKNAIVLLDTKNREGIEAWVTLEQEDMAVFERDDELLAYASSNPSIYIV
ncbi:hypothetical protein L6164_026288 [Bauhinia variegata]|uniref:Uncharacterized protein n=1 Tax=Bauhinia variegata TaxID=167791 RepID=A0ACB9LQ78_BAUVA|nr:hypothetical protein L6164_026288 [Bauhinia variegata]